MPDTLGPCIGNRFSGRYRTVFKPHLCERLALASCRNTALGHLTTEPAGRLSFVPNYILAPRALAASPATPTPAFLPGTRVRVTASVAQLMQQELCRLDACEAETVAGREGLVEEHSVCRELGLVAVVLDGLRWAFMPQYLTQSGPAEDGAVERIDTLRVGR
ncbi:hypothetical protein [Azohydromonas lata]|uniref:hypothetical protein n=1 Tax=Azohydromonas lata TaxID=45677 RepID=UPI0012F4F7C9|nr:hypothetical protein [Azohydromonas lata]